MTIEERAAQRFGKRDPSMFDVLDEAVSDHEYQTSREARDRWHRMLQTALKHVDLPKCPVCGFGFVPPGRQSCSNICASTLRNYGALGPRKKVTAAQRQEIMRLHDAGLSNNAIAEQVGVTWFRVRSVVTSGRKRVLTEEERVEIIKQFNAGAPLEAIARSVCMRRELVKEAVVGLTRPRNPHKFVNH
jgi:predicted nucleic acid-binding Zn ribbon protein